MMKVVGLRVNGTEADVWEGPAPAGATPWNYFHRIVSVDNSTSAQYPTITIQAGNNSATRHAFVPKNPEVFQYDNDGNLTQDGRWNYEWNGENRLIRMTTRSDVPGPHYQLTFQYDWLGRRIRKTVVDLDTGQTISDLIFLYDGWNLIAEVNAQTGELIRTYVWGLDLSGTFQGAGGIGGLLWINKGMIEESYFVAYDGGGNVVRLLNSSDGDVSAQYEYGPYGEPIRENGSMAQENPIRFRTMYFEGEGIHFYYELNGYYDTINGRFIISRKVFEKPSTDLRILVPSSYPMAYRVPRPVFSDSSLCGSPQEGIVQTFAFAADLLDEATYHLLLDRGVDECKKQLRERNVPLCNGCCVVVLWKITNDFRETRWEWSRAYVTDKPCFEARAENRKLDEECQRYGAIEPALARHRPSYPIIHALGIPTPKAHKWELAEKQEVWREYFDIVNNQVCDNPLVRRVIDLGIPKEQIKP